MLGGSGKDNNEGKERADKVERDVESCNLLKETPKTLHLDPALPAWYKGVKNFHN